MTSNKMWMKLKVEINAPTLMSTMSSRGKKRTKETSKRWNHFGKLPMGNDGIQKCKCKYCYKKFTSATIVGACNLLHHMKKCLMTNTRDIGHMPLSTSQDTTCLSDAFELEKFRELLVVAITMHSLSFQFVEYLGIRTCFEYARHSLNLISRNTRLIF